MAKREKIEVTSSMIDAVVQMSEGNPGAASVIGEMLKSDLGMVTILHLDDMNIRGSQIWVGYKDHCGGEIDTFIEAAVSRSPEMIEAINRECYRPEIEGCEHQAVSGGASYI